MNLNYEYNYKNAAGLQIQRSGWIYSSATNYQDIEGIIEVEKISQRLITIK